MAEATPNSQQPGRPDVPLYTVGKMNTGTTDNLQVRLAAEIPPWHAFLANPDAIMISTNEERAARAKYREAQERDPEAVAKLQGTTLHEAKRVLTGILGERLDN